MKRILFLLAAVCFVGVASAQKIKENKIDKFSKAHIINTSYEKVVSDKSVLGSAGGRLMKNVWVAFKGIDGTPFLCVKWCANEILSVQQGAELILIDGEGETHTFKNIKSTVSGKGEGTVGAYGSALYGLSLFYTGDFSVFADKKFTDMRLNTTEGYIDFTISDKKQDMFSKLYVLFDAEMKK